MKFNQIPSSIKLVIAQQRAAAAYERMIDARQYLDDTRQMTGPSINELTDAAENYYHAACESYWILKSIERCLAYDNWKDFQTWWAENYPEDEQPQD